MSETIDPAAPASAAATVAQQPRPRRPWTRSHAIVLLIGLSLVPGLVAAAARSWWHELPAGVRTSAYILSGIFIVAACGLMLLQKDPPGHAP